MAIGTIDRTEVTAPTTLKTPRTWGDLQTLNSLIPSHFQSARFAALSGKDGSTFGTLDSMLVSAVWSRRDTDNPTEPLPVELQKAASEMLELMHIHQQETTVEKGAEVGRRIIQTISGLIAACREKITGTARKDAESE